MQVANDYVLTNSNPHNEVSMSDGKNTISSFSYEKYNQLKVLKISKDCKKKKKK